MIKSRDPIARSSSENSEASMRPKTPLLTSAIQSSAAFASPFCAMMERICCTSADARKASGAGGSIGTSGHDAPDLAGEDWSGAQRPTDPGQDLVRHEMMAGVAGESRPRWRWAKEIAESLRRMVA